MRVVCRRCRRRLDLLRGEPAVPSEDEVTAALRESFGERAATGNRYQCHHCRGDWPVRPDRLATAYRAAARADRVIVVPLLEPVAGREPAAGLPGALS